LASKEKGTTREISTSKIRKRTAITKNWKENGELILRLKFKPHSNGDSSSIQSPE
jgi:hypothetical protein